MSKGRVHGRRSPLEGSIGRPGGGMAPAITPKNQDVIQKQKSMGTVGVQHRNSKEWLPPVKRASGKELQYFDHSDGRLKVAYKEGVFEDKTEDLVPSTILENYRSGKLKKELLPIRLFQAGIAVHPRQFKDDIDGAERALEGYVSKNGDTLRRTGFSTLPPKKKIKVDENDIRKPIRKLTMISTASKKVSGQESSPQAQHGNGIEKPGTDDDIQLETKPAPRRYETGDNIGPKSGIVKDREFSSTPNRESASGFTPAALNVQAKIRHQLLSMSEEQKDILRAKLVGFSSSMQTDDKEFKRVFS